ncbi:hypothetical protein [Neobacillus sp. CF12]|uniref:hypothetical protein n=1 Tax=Neobacillus sp. CF12 TaxID=3055864 RepID=UPI0025A304B9|nr:hypothetical protein [Neobacillus sp. CF12]MDM5326685.1 hypothetical protein [Neobacillus sp. CF12]
MGIFLFFILIYFIVKVIGIYKKDIVTYFKKWGKEVRIIIICITLKPLLRRLDELGFYKYTNRKLAEELKKKSIKSGLSIGMKQKGFLWQMLKIWSRDRLKSFKKKLNHFY